MCVCVCVCVRVRVCVCVCACVIHIYIYIYHRAPSQDPEQMRAMALRIFRNEPDALRSYAIAAGEYMYPPHILATNLTC
jgi:hypothetical protein